MKLLRLKIDEPFRSLQPGFELEFMQQSNDDSPTYAPFPELAPHILAGPNGSGKSNILEVLASIFFHLECMYLDTLPDTFVFDEESNPTGFQSSHSTPDAFEIEYRKRTQLIPLKNNDKYAHILIRKEKGKSPKWFISNFKHQEGDTPFDMDRTIAREFLPKYVLGYSSGENEILSLPFFKMRFINFDEYKSRLLNRFDYDGKPEGRMVYLDSSFSQAIVISNLLLQDEEKLKPFREEVGVEDIKSFRIVLNKITFEDIKKAVLFDPDNVDSVINSSDEIADREITEYLNTHIEALQKCSSSHFEADGETLYLDYLVTDATKEAFRAHFGSALELFQVFQILLTLNLYTVSNTLRRDLYTSNSLYVSETIPVLASDERIMRFKHVDLKKQGVDEQVTLKSLSDGEHQFLHSLGLCLLYQEDDTLFLLDEPETHFNPPWRANFISRIRECFNGADGDAKVPEILITTHTPFLISDSKPENVFVFKKENDEVSVTHPDYNTLGASINKITFSTFNKAETIGRYAEQRMNIFKDQFEKIKGQAKAADLQALIDDINITLGESVEKVLFTKTIIDFMEVRKKEEI
jgi:restriction system-associated AAA family ATPase